MKMSNLKRVNDIKGSDASSATTILLFVETIFTRQLQYYPAGLIMGCQTNGNGIAFPTI